MPPGARRSLQIVSEDPRRRNECSAPLVHYDLGCELGSSGGWQCHFYLCYICIGPVMGVYVCLCVSSKDICASTC